MELITSGVANGIGADVANMTCAIAACEAGGHWEGAVSLLAEMQMAADGSRLVIFAATLDSPVAVQPPPLRLTGLDPTARYRLRMIEKPLGHHTSHTAISRDEVTLTGAALMAQGVALPPAFPQTVAVIEGMRL